MGFVLSLTKTTQAWVPLGSVSLTDEGGGQYSKPPDRAEKERETQSQEGLGGRPGTARVPGHASNNCRAAPGRDG